jgi:hypothetical protein
MKGDIFGIGTGIKSMIAIFIHNARQTGRTTFMVNGLQDGDMVIVVNAQQGKEIERLFTMNESKRGMRISWKAVEPGDFYSIDFNPRSKGRLIFDHVWVEMTYEQAVNDVSHRIAQLQRHASGPTSKQMKEMDAERMRKINGKYEGDWLI